MYPFTEPEFNVLYYISVPATASGVAIAGSGLAITGSTLANMFDVRIQKSKSSQGKESGKNSSESVSS